MSDKSLSIIIDNQAKTAKQKCPRLDMPLKMRQVILATSPNHPIETSSQSVIVVESPQRSADEE